MAYFDTPRTDAGNATYLDNGKAIDDLSVEMSFVEPKNRNNLVAQMRGPSRGGPRTPGHRGALLDRPNIAKRGGAVEFTPLMKSARKKMAYKGKENNNPLQTPGFLKTLHEGDETAALPVSESSVIIASESDNTDTALRQAAVNNLPNANSSGIMSTPMLRDGNGGRMLEDGKNLMTLRQQEEILNKTEKENFGLKLKIHYFEEMLAKSDPNLNQEAIRQNVDLRIDRVTLQKELNKVKKQLLASARDAESLRQQLLVDQARSDQKAADGRFRKELEILRQTVQTREEEIEKLQFRLDSEGKTQEVDNLKGTIEDLEADLREKERLIDTYEDEKEANSDQHRRIKDLESELEEANERIAELKDVQSSTSPLKQAARQAKQELMEAKAGQRQAEDERDAAIAENKEQLEEAQSNFRALREKYDLLKDGYKTKSTTIQDLETALADAKSNAQAREQEFAREIEAVRRQQEELLIAKGPSEDRLRDLIRQLNAKADEKDLLQTRHDALTNESESLQRDLSKTRSENAQLQLEVNAERQRSLDQERFLKDESRKANDKLLSENSRLRTTIEAEKHRADVAEDRWSRKFKDLQSQNDVLEKRATNLQETIDKMQKTEAKASTFESRLQTSLASEKERHEIEEHALQRRIQDLQSDLNDKRTTSEYHHNELAACKEDLRLRGQDLENALRKQEALEDEIVVLQSSMEEDSAKVRRELSQANEEIRQQQKRNSSSEVEIIRLKSELQAAETKVDSLREDVRSRSTRKNQNEGHLVELKNLVADLQADNRKLSSALKQAETRVNRLENQVEEEQRALVSFKRDQEGKTSRTSELEAENRAISRQLRSAQTQIEELEAQATAGHKDQSVLRHDQDERQAQIQNLQSEKRSLSIRISEALERIVDLESQLQAERNKHDTFRTGQGHNQEVLRDLQSQKDSLSAQLSQALLRVRELETQATAGYKNDNYSRYESSSQPKDSSILNRETSYKIQIARLEEKVQDLRDQLRSQPYSIRAPATPARSPVLASVATPNEIAELRGQLADARKQSKTYRDQVHDLEKKARKTTASLEMAAHNQDEEVWRLRRDLEKKTDDLQLGQAELAKIREAVEKSTSKLRGRIQELEQDLRQARLAQSEDDTMAMERQDLHDMLKSAKLEAEELRVQLNDHLAQVNASQEREKILRANMQKIRGERAEQQQRAAALSDELSRLQDQYDDKVEELYQQGSRDDVPQIKDKKTTAEMKGLAKQIDWLKQNLTREKNFRYALAYEKKYFLEQIKMYDACNQVDIDLLKQVGCYTKAQKKPKAKSIRPYANAIIALIRMRNLSASWVSDQKHHKDYLKKVDQARGKRRVSGLKR